MKRVFLTAITAVIVSALSFASTNTPFAVKATVADSIGEPESFATVRVYTPADSVKPAAMGVSSESGAISLSLPKAGAYILKLFSVGRAPLQRQFEVTAAKPVANLGMLTVNSDDRMLGEVTVTATRPLVTKEIDRIGYDVQADDESRTSTLEEMLKKVPLVTVDSDGAIKVKGSSDFKIYKNGRPNNSFTKNAKEIFKAIPASMIKKIEVITDPGAREDAEGVGAILNIVTLDNTTMAGVMGNLSLRYDTNSTMPSPNLWGTGQIDKVTLSLYGGAHRISKRQSENFSHTTTRYHDTGNTLSSAASSTSKGWITFFGLDGSYEMDSLNLFTAEFGGYYYSVSPLSSTLTSMTDAEGSEVYRYTALGSADPYSYFDMNGNFNYQRTMRHPGEMLTLSYMISTTRQTQNSLIEYTDARNLPVPYTGILSNFKLNFIEHTFQADWCRPIATIHTLDLGAKYIYRDNHSRTRQSYIGYREEPLLDFTHLTHVAALYADWRVRLGRLNLRAGLRYEFSRLQASYADDENPSFAANLSDWVPNAAISYNLNDANTLKLSFGTRINRPGISYLNPQVSSSPNATSQGNPDLESARNSSINLNYNLIGQKVNLDFSAGYSFTNNAVISVQEVRGDHLYSSYANAGHNKSFDAGIFFQWTASRKTSLMLNTNVSYNHYQNKSLAISNAGWSAHGFAQLSQKLPWNLTAMLRAMLWTGSPSGLYGSYRPVGSSILNYGVSLQRGFLKEDRLTVRVELQNPFGRHHSTTLSKSKNLAYDQRSESVRLHSFAVAFSVSWRFGSINAQVKKTARKIENDDLSGRKNQ